MTAPNSPSGAALIAAERRRQLTGCGFTLVFDRRWNVGGQLLRAAECYETPAELRDIYQPRRLVLPMPRTWPWGAALWKPKSREQDLVRAGALYQAEADRLAKAGRRAAAELCEERRDRCAAALDDLLASAVSA